MPKTGKNRLREIRASMLQRCENPKCKSYPRYGGRGITVCEEWHKSDAFIEWAFANGYADDLSIDRIDNNKGYYPDNCRWATRKEQQNNQRTNFRVKAFGLDLTSTEWGEMVGMDRKTLRLRLAKGMTPEEALTKPLQRGGAKRQLKPILTV